MSHTGLSPLPQELTLAEMSDVQIRAIVGELLIRQALFVNLARAEVSKPLDGLKLNGIGTLQ